MQHFWEFAQQRSQLYQQLLVLRPRMAQAAQKIYNDWEADEDQGSGGICDEISNALASIAVESIPNVDCTDGGHDGDDHAWTVIYNNQEAFGVDIPPHLYERGGGYNWTKLPGVIFRPNDIEIFPLERNLVV